MDLLRTTAVASALLVFAMTASLAATAGGAPAGLPTPRYLNEGAATRAPLGLIELCRRAPGECARGSDADVVPASLDERRYRALGAVNRSVNRAIVAASDSEIHGKADLWSVNPSVGDCEDYALTKRRLLISDGWPASALLIAVARDERGDHHAVLVARTEMGDLVLDNRREAVVGWSELPYRWIKMQSPRDPRRWLRLDGYEAEMIDRLSERLERLRANSVPDTQPLTFGSPSRL